MPEISRVHDEAYALIFACKRLDVFYRGIGRCVVNQDVFVVVTG